MAIPIVLRTPVLSTAVATIHVRTSRRNAAIGRRQTTIPAIRAADILSSALTIPRNRARIPHRVPIQPRVAATQRRAAAVTVAAIAVVEALAGAVLRQVIVTVVAEAHPAAAAEVPATAVEAQAMVVVAAGLRTVATKTEFSRHEYRVKFSSPRSKFSIVGFSLARLKIPSQQLFPRQSVS